MIDFTQKDKQGHFFGGAVLAFVFSFLSPFLGAFVAFVAGLGKEIYDSYHPENHTADKLDMYATWLGGIFGIIVFFTIKVIFDG